MEEVDRRAPWRVVEDFERALADYCGSPYAVAVDSATNALRLCFRLRFGTMPGDPFSDFYATIPAHTYVGVVQAAREEAVVVEFEEVHWEGEYEIGPLRILDSAKWLRRNMYRAGALTCLSFQAFKQLPIGRGGAILCDDPGDREWLQRASFDGRRRDMRIADQETFQRGMHAYMSPPDAARGLWLLSNMPDNPQPIGSWRDYPDLRTKEFS
jgi:dTDP-4-amino-4,6-dideoxygalactose transaminase